MKDVIYNISFEVDSNKAQKDVQKLNYEIKDLGKSTSSTSLDQEKLAKATDTVTKSMKNQTDAIKTSSRAEADALKTFKNVTDQKTAFAKTQMPNPNVTASTNSSNVTKTPIQQSIVTSEVDKVQEALQRAKDRAKIINENPNLTKEEVQQRLKIVDIQRQENKLLEQKVNSVKKITQEYDKMTDKASQFEKDMRIKVQSSERPKNPYIEQGINNRPLPVSDRDQRILQNQQIKIEKAQNKNQLATINQSTASLKADTAIMSGMTSELNKLNERLKSLAVSLKRFSVSQLEMSKNLNKIPKAFTNLADSAESASQRIQKSGRSSFATKFINLGYMATAFHRIKGMVMELSQIISVPLELTIAKEKFQTSLEVLLGSSLKAKAKTDELIQFAAKTPLEMSDIEPATNTLLAFGIEADKLIPTMKMLGDLSRGNAANFSGLSLIFGQAKATGRVMGQDLNQLANRGVPILQELAKHYKKTVAEIREMGKRGELTFDVIEKSMQRMTSAGGQFDGMMVKMSQTTGGKLSTIKDQIKILVVDGFETIMPAVHAVMDGIVMLIQGMYAFGSFMRSLPRTISENAEGLTLLAGGFIMVSVQLLATGKIVMQSSILMRAHRAAIAAYSAVVRTATMVQTAWNAALLANPIGLAVAAVTILIGSIYLLNKAMDDSNEKAERRAELMEEVNHQTEKEQQLVSALFDELHDLNTSYERRQAIVKEINEQYGEYLPYMMQEYSMLGQLESMYDRVSEAIRANMLAKIQAKAQEEAMEARIDAENKIRKNVLAKGGTKEEAAKAVRDVRKLGSDVEFINKNKVDAQRLETIKTDISSNEQTLKDLKAGDVNKDSRILQARKARLEAEKMAKQLEKDAKANKNLKIGADKALLAEQKRLEALELQKTEEGIRDQYKPENRNKMIEQTNARLATLKTTGVQSKIALEANLKAENKEALKLMAVVNNTKEDIVDNFFDIVKDNTIALGDKIGLAGKHTMNAHITEELVETLRDTAETQVDAEALKTVVAVRKPTTAPIAELPTIKADKAKKAKKPKFYDEKHLKVDPFEATLDPMREYSVELDKVAKKEDEIRSRVRDPYNPLKLNVEEMKKETDALFDEVKKREITATEDLSSKREKELKQLEDQIAKAKQDMADAEKSGDEEKILELKIELAPILNADKQNEARAKIEKNFLDESEKIRYEHDKNLIQAEEASHAIRLAGLAKFMKQQEDLYKEGLMTIMDIHNEFIQMTANLEFASFDMKLDAISSQYDITIAKLNKDEKRIQEEIDDTLKQREIFLEKAGELDDRLSGMIGREDSINAGRVKIEKDNLPLIENANRYKEAIDKRKAEAQKVKDEMTAEASEMYAPPSAEKSQQKSDLVGKIGVMEYIIGTEQDDKLQGKRDEEKKKRDQNRQELLKNVELGKGEIARLDELQQQLNAVTQQLSEYDRQTGGNPEQRQAEIARLTKEKEVLAQEFQASKLQVSKLEQDKLIIALRKNEAEFQKNLDFILNQTEKMEAERVEKFRGRMSSLAVEKNNSVKFFSFFRDINYQMGAYEKTFEGRELQNEIDQLEQEFVDLQHAGNMIQKQIDDIKAEVQRLEAIENPTANDSALLEANRRALTTMQSNKQANQQKQNELKTTGTKIVKKTFKEIDPETGKTVKVEREIEVDDPSKTSGKIPEAKSKKKANKVKHNKEKLMETLNGIQQLASATIKAIGDVIQAEVQIIDKAIDAQQKKVDKAREKANESKQKGDAEMLQLEEERLELLNKKKEEAVEKQRSLALIEMIINTAVLVTKAAAEGGGIGSAFTIAIALASLAGGLIAARLMATSGFEKGGYTGQGTHKLPGENSKVAGYVHENEFVFDSEKTSNYRDIFERIHNGSLDLRKLVNGQLTKTPSIHLTDTLRHSVLDNMRNSLIDNLVNNKLSLSKEFVDIATKPLTVNVINPSDNAELFDSMITSINSLHKTIKQQERLSVNIDERGFSMKVNEVIKSKEAIRKRTS